MNKPRQSSRLDWAESSLTRWIQLPLLSWLTPILSLGNKKILSDDDLNDLSHMDKASVLLGRIDQYSGTWPGTWHVLTRTFYKDFVLSILLTFPLVMTHAAQPMLIRYIVLYIKDELPLPSYSGYLLAIGLFLTVILQALTHQQIFFRNSRMGMRVRNTLSSVIYKHLLAINTSALHHTTAAQSINLIANDANKFEELSMFVHTLVLIPLEASVTFGLVWWNIGLPTMFGFGVLILLIPLQFIFSRQFSKYRRQRMICTDKRLQAISELVSGCQIIKMYNWEKAMERRVNETRRRELSNIYKASYLRTLNIALSFGALPLICLATFGGSWLMGKNLFIENVFAVLAFFVMARVPITITMPTAIEKFSEARVSARRIDKFMQLNIIENNYKITGKNDSDYAIVMDNASFSWKENNTSPYLFNLKIKKGSFVGVRGVTGAGKSTLLAAILGEINLINGKRNVYISSMSYAPQSSWIFADTIRANILLGKTMDEERYKTVIHACCLDTDFENFGRIGDLLIIGDKGINLSGGQKARISLARALYADADLYLLDDPLAAVDPKVAHKIYDQCIGPHSLLSNKTRILVTHQTHFLTEADQALLLVDGYAEEVDKEHRPTFDSSFDVKTNWTLDTTTNDMSPIVRNETTFEGNIKFDVWLKLFTAPPLRSIGLFFLVIFMFASEALYDFTNNWLAIWSSKNAKEQRSPFYAYIYVGAVTLTLIVALIRVAISFTVMLHGADFFHNEMLKGILYTSLRFYESNPSGRILNRASKDQQVLDESLPLALIEMMQYLFMTIGTIAVIGITNPWVLLILIPLVPTILWLRRFYMRSSRQIKRLESVARSPVYTLFSTTLDGLTSIRAFNVQDDFLKMFIERIDTNSRAYFVLFSSARWFGIRLDLTVSVLTFATTILGVALRHQINPSAAALSISYCVTLTGLFQWAIRQSTEAENFMTSAERIHEYGELVRETDENNHDMNINSVSLMNDWPSRGVIEFRDYSMRYRSELDPVLKNVNIRIESMEKIGIIGRTGSGKSSLLQALFRLVDQSTVSGSILIDDIDISRISLDYLRSHISVIPQTPVLFCGSLRYNVDPFSQYTDEECLMALEAVQLKQLVRNHPDGLHLLIAESGANLSAGESQLICVARAILRKSRILLIDEATANVDQATDQMIQQVISDKFRDRTILTIAHRLNTIMNSDRILMLQNGDIAFFDVPSNIQLLS